RAVAERFDNGIEFFSTFGGSNLSCRIGKTVLDIVDDEGLQDNAGRVGAHLIDGLRDMQTRYQSIADVRGLGLFIGVDLANPDGSEATALCTYVKNRLRDNRILIGSEGPQDNILKIRPPLTFALDDADMLITHLDRVLSEAASYRA
ncbi:MAG: aminotransferase class III-fold pyridoxal phosphate-dependent enzyme, partial [Pseudomonadota bacterium]